jgi:hypothetical protein
MTELKYLNRAVRDGVSVNADKVHNVNMGLGKRYVTNYEKNEWKIAQAEKRRHK